MKSTLSRTNRFSKPVPLDSTQRSAKVSRQHELYRKKFMEEIRAAINETDYLVTMANDSPAQMYLSQTGRHKPNKITNVELPTDPEEIERLKFKNPTSPRIPSYMKKRTSAASPSQRYDIENASDGDDAEGIEIVTKPLNLSPEKDLSVEEEQEPEVVTEEEQEAEAIAEEEQEAEIAEEEEQEAETIAEEEEEAELATEEEQEAEVVTQV